MKNDYINTYIKSNEYEKDKYYWNNLFLNIEKQVKFYNIQTNRYKRKKVIFKKDELNIYLKNNKISEFNFILGIFSLYLSRIDNTEGCLLKTNIIKNGLSINTLLKIDYDENISFNDYLININKIYGECIEHTKIDIENYIEIDSYYSIYDFTNPTNIKIENDDNTALTLNIYDNALELIYNDDLFDDIYIEHMLMNITSFINNALNNPNQLCKDISIICDEDKSLLAEFCKGREIDADYEKNLALAFHENAIKNPDALAVDDGVNQITYSELDKLTNSIAHDLHNNYNINRGTPVALMISRNYHFPTLVLALNKIGAVAVPIDPDYPISRIEHMINISQSENIIISKKFIDSYDFNINTLCFEDLNADNNIDMEITSHGDDLFAIMFTSGTTGLPKGVKVANKQISQVAAVHKNMFKTSDRDILGSYASFSFAVSYGIYWALYLGACSRIFNDDERKDSLLLIKALKEKPIKIATLPPGIGIPIFENEELKLKYMGLGGAKIEKLPAKDTHTKFVNIYGTTEIIFAISKIYDNNDHITMGKPVDNTWIYILDKNNKQVPIGVPGEICVSSDHISPGYLNGDSNDNVFIKNPYSDCEKNKRMYKTGDVGFYNFDGEIEIIGRKDDQLSVRGFRVESSEIIRILNNFDIKENYIDVENDNLTLYYTTTDYVDANTIKESLKKELPEYMIPSFFIELDKIPLNANGKVDKFALRNIHKTDVDEEIEDETLKVVVEGFKKVLNKDFVLTDDNFVALGGNSLTAMKLQLFIKNETNINLSSNKIMELSTPHKISNYIKFNSSPSSVDKLNYDFNELCPLSDSQLNVYLDETVNKMGTAYNNSFKLEIDNSFSVNEIKNAVKQLLNVHPVLTARIIEKNGITSFSFDAEPKISEGSLPDIESFVEPFELNKYLSRFLIIKNEKSTILCIDCHHLVFDGTSLNILINDFERILNDETIDSVDNGVLRQISYEENNIKNSEYMNEAEKFFDEMLTDNDECRELLASINTESTNNEYNTTLNINNNELNSFLREKSLTYNQFFTSVFAYTLSRYSGSSKVLFNLIEDGRGYVDLSNSIGMFVRTLPILVDCKNQNVDAFLKYSSDMIKSTMRNDLYPFHILANKYELKSDIFFQYAHDIFYNAQNNRIINSVEELKHDIQGNLSVYIFNQDKNEYGIKILYSDKFNEEFIERFTESYKSILQELMNVNSLSEIEYTSKSDLKILNTINNTEHELKYGDILEAFNDNLNKYPNNNLVTYNDVSYTYSEGAFIADKIAKELISLGAKNQDSIAFLVERSELYLLSVLGILSIGGVYVPLDDTHPDERIKFIIKDSDAKVILTSNSTYERACNLESDAIILNISQLINVGTLSNLSVVNGDLACILYTSGTTGIPKGVKINRKSIINLATTYTEKYGLTNDDVYGLFSTIGFDAALLAFINVLYSGACLSVVPEDIRLDINTLNEYFIKHNVTHTLITTQVSKLFMQNVENTSLDVLLVGGEKLGEFESPNDYTLIDAYGPTETCVFISSIKNSDKIDPSSIGSLIYNTKAYILDDECRQVPIGAVGELYVAGNPVASGYINRPDENDHAFLQNPFSDNTDYNIMYRTGDTVRLLDDKTIAIVGRADNQVKIRGNRVELSEIESTIRELDYVDDITVQTVKNGTNNELVAYVVPSENIENINDYVCDYISHNKPEYMVPSFVVELDEIPVNINGKVDKRALPEVDIGSLHAEYVAPMTKIEKDIVNAFESVFNQTIGMNDDFSRLGGDSLTAIKLISSLSKYNITAADILSLHTPKAIAENIEKTSLDLDLYSLEEGCPLNEPQLNVYLDIIANKKVDSYLIPLKINIPKKYSSEKVHDTVKEILNIHPILKMCISEKHEVPHLIKCDESSIIIKTDDEKSVKDFLREPFDLYKNLCRFLIIETEDEYALYAVFHHLIFDGMSSSVFKRDLFKLLDDEKIDLDDSFLKVSAFNQQIKETEEYKSAEEFYDMALTDNEEVNNLLDDVLADGPGICQSNLDIDNELLNEFLSKHNVNENILFTSIFAYTLSRFTGGDKVLFNIIENGRDRFNNFDAIGMYVNTLPILADCKNQPVSMFLDSMSDLTYKTMQYNYYSFRLLANKYNIDSNILFQYQPDWFNSEFNTDLFNKDLIENSSDLISDFAADVIQKNDQYILNITYSDKYSKNTAEKFIKTFKLILSQILDVNELSEINYITEEDLKLINSYNNTDYELTHDDIMDAFNESISKYPDNKLVSFENNSYTYSEGAFIAKQIAEKLLSSSVEKQEHVAFLVKRSESYMFSILSILSVGAVYVPLDDKHPDDRLKLTMQILKQS